MGLFSGGGLGSLVGGVGGFMLGGPAGAMIGSSLGGGLLGGMSQEAVQQQQFQPFPVRSPFGTMTFNPQTRQIGLNLSPEQRAIHQDFLGAMGGGPFGLSPEQASVANMGNLLAGQTLGLGAQSGLFGRGLGMEAAGLGSQFLQSAGATDPDAIAAEQFGRMQQLIAPERAKRRQATENRLLRQGLLQSTAGDRRFGEIEQAENMADIRMANEALSRGMETQRGLFGMGLQGMQAGQGLFGAGTSAELGALGQGFGFAQAPLQQRQQALQNYMTLFGGQQAVGDQLFRVANLGMQAGGQQAQVNAANAAAQQAANQNNQDMMAGLMQSGLTLAAMGGL